MKATIAICTWNRSRLLAGTLESLERLEIPPGLDWEVLVVDNASSDDTKSVIGSFVARLPIQYLFEPEQGHSRSRNRAVEHASGDVMLWTDNDVRVDQRWLLVYLDGFARHPHAAFLGGRIKPVLEESTPTWLAETWDKCKPAYADRDLGDREIAIPPAGFPFGANFAVRTEVQRKFPYRVTLGRQGDGLLGDDEINVMQQMVDCGHTGMWLPESQVTHLIPSDRATPQYIANYFQAQGIANVLRNAPTMKSRFHAWRVAWHHHACFTWKRKSAPADVWVSHMIRSRIAWGEFLAWGKTS